VRVCSAVLDNGGLEVLCGSMQTFPDHLSMVEGAIAAAAQLCLIGAAQRQQIVAQGVLPPVLSAVKRNGGHVGVQTAASDLFQLLSGACV
jgi:hypothetical protein